MRTERELAHVLGHERELELSSHFGSRDELNEERVQILASDSERELAHIFHELLMLCICSNFKGETKKRVTLFKRGVR